MLVSLLIAVTFLSSTFTIILPSAAASSPPCLGDIGFDTFPDGSPVPDRTRITDQYVACGVELFTTEVPSGPFTLTSSIAISPPNILGSEGPPGQPLFTSSIGVEFVSPVSEASINALEVGFNGLILDAFNSANELVDSASVVHPGNPSGASDILTVSGDDIVRLLIRQITPGSRQGLLIDGYGIDNLRFPATVMDNLPALVDDSTSTNEDTPVTTDVLGNDSGLGDVPVVVTIETPPANGLATVNPDNTITYTPNENFNGADSYSYRVTDVDGDTDAAQVFVTVNSVNDGPTAANQNFVTPEDTTINGQLVAGDPDFDLLRFTPETQPTKGTLTLNLDGSFTYTPNANANGLDQFRVRVSDGNQAVDSFFDVFVDITAINDSPAANAGADQSIDEDTFVTLTGSGSDADGDTLAFSWAQTAGTPVTLSDASAASPAFTAPLVGPAGETLAFDLTVSDGNGGMATDSVSIQVNNVDLVPPEAYNQFDPVTKDVLVFGTDDVDGNLGPITPTSVVPTRWNADDDDDEDDDEDRTNAELRTYVITDAAGNTLTLEEIVKMKGKEIKVKVTSIQYGDDPAITPPKNKKAFEWSLDKNGSIKELEQKMTVGKGEGKQKVEAKYDSKKDQTKIKSAKPKMKETLPGLVLLKMSTDNGNLVIGH